MSGETEFANRRGGDSDYPSPWGRPPGTRFSAERASWVRDGVRQWQADPERRLRQLAQVEHRQAVAELLRDVRHALRTAPLTDADRTRLAAAEKELAGRL